MIRHVVLFTAKRPEDVAVIEEELSVLAQNPHVRHLEIARNLKADSTSFDVDVVVYGEFENEDALAAFKAHPAWHEATSRVRPLRDTRLVADWNTATARGHRAGRE